MRAPLCVVVASFLKCVASFPSNLNSVAFPESALWQKMGATGAFTSSIFDSNTNRIKCENGDGMIAVFGKKNDYVVGGNKYTAQPSWNRYDIRKKISWSAGVSVHFHPNSTKSVKVMCAQYGRKWAYTAYSINRGNYDPFKIEQDTIVSDVLIIGAGVGGLSVAAALDPSIDVTVISAAGVSGSTSALSTGVVWFPNASKHTVPILLEAEGAPDNDDSGRIGAYITQGESAFLYWDTYLNFKPFTSLDKSEESYDYTNYTQGEQQGQSFEASACSNTGHQTCGSVLAMALKNKSNAKYINYEASAVEMSPSQNFIVYFTNQSVFATAPILVIATGGDGSSSSYMSDVVLAFSNNGFARKVATQLELKPSSDNDSFYHLEWSRTGNSWSARWFAADGCVPISKPHDYDLCADYSTRSQRLNVGQEYETELGNYVCTTNHGNFWKTYMSTAYQNQNLYGSCPNNTKLRAGIIDSKASFELGAHYESVDQQRLFASGTSAAAFTKDAYFAPGATLGLGLVTGHEIAKMIPTRLAEFKAMQQGAADGKQRRSCTAPYLFIAGVWLGAIGIVAHLFPKSESRSKLVQIKNIHYVAMPAAVILITAGVFVARECSKETNTPEYVKSRGGTQGAYHYLAGYILLVVLWAQVLLGIALKAYDPKKSPKRRWAGIAHRILGALLFILLAAQYLTVLYPRDSYAMKHYSDNYNALAVPSIIFTIVVGGYIAYVFKQKIIDQSDGKITMGTVHSTLPNRAPWL